MKKPLLVFLSLLFFIGTRSSAQEAPRRSPEEIWQEYAGLKPTNEELLSRLYDNYQEAYRRLAAQELLKRDLSNREYVELVDRAPEPFARYAWELLKPVATNEDLIFVFGWDNDCRDLALEEIEKRSLTEDDLKMLADKSPEKYLEKTWGIILARHPSITTLLAIAGTTNGHHADKAVAELLERSDELTTNQLSWIANSYASKELKDIAAEKVFARPDADISDFGRLTEEDLSCAKLAAAKVDELESISNKKRKDELIQLMLKPSKQDPQ